MTVHGGGRVVLPRSGAGAARLVRQDRGRVQYRVDPGAPWDGPALAVVAPALVATVEGTAFDLEIGDGAAELRVTSGLVAVTPRGRSIEGRAPDAVEVAAGEGFRVAAAAGGPARGRLFRFAGDAPPTDAPSRLTAAAILSALLTAGAVLFVVGRGGAGPAEARRRPRPR